MYNTSTFVINVLKQIEELNRIKKYLISARLISENNNTCDYSDKYISDMLNILLCKWETNLHIISDSYILYHESDNNKDIIECSFNLINIDIQSTIAKIASIIWTKLGKNHNDLLSIPDSQLKHSYILVINIIFHLRLSLDKKNNS
jgi:hypothetical protein